LRWEPSASMASRVVMYRRRILPTMTTRQMLRRAGSTGG
jgi:hypothetical protein